MSTFCDKHQHGEYTFRVQEKSKDRTKENEQELNDRRAASGLCRQLPFYHLQQAEGSWLCLFLCRPSVFRAMHSFSSPGTCFSFASLHGRVHPYREQYPCPCRGHPAPGDDEGCENAHGPHVQTCGEERRACRNAIPTREDFSPTLIYLSTKEYRTGSVGSYLNT